MFRFSGLCPLQMAEKVTYFLFILAHSPALLLWLPNRAPDPMTQHLSSLLPLPQSSIGLEACAWPPGLSWGEEQHPGP